MTPNRMMLGREVNLPSELIFQPAQQEHFENEEQYVTSLRTNIQKTHEIARNTLRTTQETMKRDYDANTKQFEYHPGDMVYILDTAHIKGRAKKLDPHWKGPAIVVKKLCSYIYKVLFERGTVAVTNHDRMKRCNDRHIPSWLCTAKEKILDGEDMSRAGSTLPLYCICKQPDDGSFMIGCDRCGDWMHGRCVNITKEIANQITVYHCPRCQTPWLYPLRV